MGSDAMLTASKLVPARLSASVCQLAAALLALASICLQSACAWLPNAKQVKTEARKNPVEWLIQKNGDVLNATEAESYLREILSPLGDTTAMLEHMQLEQLISGLPLVTGNRAKLLIDGPATYAAMFAAIRKSQHHVHLNAYIFSDEGVGQELAELLIEKSSQGIKVRIIHDAIGALDTPDAFFENLKDKGIEVVRFNPIDPVEDLRIWRINHREHAKLLVVDGRTAFTGGVNISSVYTPAPSRFSSYRGAQDAVHTRAWRDTHLQLNGPVVPYLQSRFLDTWQTLTGEAIADRDSYMHSIGSQGSVAVRVLDSPADNQELEAYTLYLSAIVHAQKRLWITQSYFSPNAEILDALEAAAARGVDVRILLPGVTDQDLVYLASRSKYGRLLKAGVRLWEFQDRVLHAKTAVVDSLWATIGSANLDIRSFIHNNELNVSLLNSEFAAQLEQQFETDLRNAAEVTLAQWHSRSFMDRLKETGARLLDYWL